MTSSYPKQYLKATIFYRMPRVYKRKTNRREWTQDSLVAAMREVRNGSLCCNAAAITYDIPEPTLRRYLKRDARGEEFPDGGGRFKNTFNVQQTQEFVSYLTECNQRGLGLTSTQVRKLAYQYAEANGIEHRFNREIKAAGTDWFKSFSAHNNMSLRNPEATSIARLRGFNKIAVDKFFTILEEVRIKYKFKADRIYNADESGLSTVPTKLPKVITPKGQRRVAKIVTAERGRNTTLVCAMSAAGSYVPPFLIFGRVRMKPELLNGCPPGSDGRAQPSGWMTTETFLVYLKHFAHYAKPSIDDPVLLLVDNHSSHISLSGINFCRENGIVLVGFPPHTTHRLQPLDVSFFGPFKAFYNQMCDSFLINHPGIAITDKNIGPLFGEAYCRAANINNAVSGFRACGIEPFNPLVFDDSDFVASKTTERIEQPEVNHVVLINDDDDDARPLIENADSSSSDEDDQIPLSLLAKKIKSVTTTEQTTSKESFNTSTVGRIETHKRQLFPDKDTSNDPRPTIWDVRPIAISERSSNPRKKLSSSVISGTPMKLELEQKQREIEEKDKQRKLKQEKKQLKVQNKSTIQENRAQKHRKTLSSGTDIAGSSAAHRSDADIAGPSASDPSAADIVGPSSEIIYLCPACNEEYNDPPSENWLQCCHCLSWWHEACSGYEGFGSFHCDFCE